MTTNNPVLVIQGLVVLFVIWVALRAWHDAWVSWYRQELFELRDRLFDAALDSDRITFADPTYIAAREQMNHRIRYAHALRPSLILGALAYISLHPTKARPLEVELGERSAIVCEVLNDASIRLAVFMIMTMPIVVMLIVLAAIFRRDGRGTSNSHLRDDSISVLAFSRFTVRLDDGMQLAA